MHEKVTYQCVINNKYFMNKIILASLVAVFTMSGVAFARADEDRSSEKATVRVEQIQIDMSTTTGTDGDEDSDVDMETREDDNSASRSEKAGMPEDEEQGKADEHRSEVAKFVQTLLSASTRLGGLGEEVRKIAHEQASSTEKIAESIEKIEKRSKWKTFLIGSDYQNLGEVRSEIVTTANRIERLNREMEKVASSTEKTAIAAEIQSLKDEQTKLETFVETNESKFSVFGWAVRLFLK